MFDQPGAQAFASHWRWPPRRRRRPAVPFDPVSFGMDWWEPERAYTGTPASVTGLPNQREGGAALTYAGNQPLTIVEVEARDWVQTPVTNQSQRLISDGLASGISAAENAPFTLAMAFSLDVASPVTCTLWSVASAPTPSLSRINFGLTSGFLRLFALDAAGTIFGAPTNAAVAPGDQRQTVVVSARPDGTVSVWFNGLLVNDNYPWPRPEIADLDQFSFGLLRQGTSNAQTTFGRYGALGWMPSALGDTEARALSGYMMARYN